MCLAELNRYAYFLLFLTLCSTLAFAYGPSDLTIPSDATSIVYGQSGEGRDLTAYRFGTGKNVMVLGFAIHGWEDNFDQDGGALVWAAGQLMQQLSSNTSTIDAYNWSIYVLPCMNPDGLLDGYSHNGPGRHTTTYITSSGSLSHSSGVDLNRRFPYNWVSNGSGRYYNGPAPLAAKEARALASFIQEVKGSGTNILIDTHGWTQQIISLSRSDALYTTFSSAFPSNTYSNITTGRGYFAAYAYSLGYQSCLFEFPSNVLSLRGFQSSGYSTKYNSCILSLLKSQGSYTSYTVSAVAQGSGTVSGGGSYARGQTATLIATPTSGFVFKGWYDRTGSLLSTNTTYCFPVSYNTTVYARFEAPCNLTVSVAGSGTVAGEGAYAAGTTVTLTAYPTSGWGFLGWYSDTGELLSEQNPYSFTTNQDTSLTALFGPRISASASRSGSVTGAGTYSVGSNVILTALPNPDSAFMGWYLPDGTLLTTSETYQFTAETPLSLIAMFEGDYFYDVPSGSWYEAYATECGSRGLVSGMSPFCFSPSTTMNRAMVVAILGRMDGADLSEAPACPFEDVSQTSYYAPALNWAYENGIISGIDETHFCPNDPVTREQFVAILIRYLEKCRGITLEPAELTFTDTGSISSYAVSAVSKAITIEVEFGGKTVNLIAGYEDGTFRPKGKLTRAEGVAFLTRIAVYLETSVQEDVPPEVPEDDGTPETAPEPSETTEPVPPATEMPSSETGLSPSAPQSSASLTETVNSYEKNSV